MKFVKFTVENYKGLQRFTLDVPEKNKYPIALVGLNESGKTTILQALRDVGHHAMGKHLKDAYLQSILPKTAFFSGNVSFSCDLKLEINDQEKVNKDFRNLSIVSLSYSYCYEKGVNENDIRNGLLLVGQRKIEYVKDGSDIHKDLSKKDKAILQYVFDNSPDVLFFDDFIFDIPPKISFLTTANNGKEAVDKYNHDLKNNGQNVRWQDVLDDILQASPFSKQKLSFQKDVVDLLDKNKEGESSVKQIFGALSLFLTKAIARNWVNISGKNFSFKEIVIEPDLRKDVPMRFYSISVKSKNKTDYQLSERSKGCKWYFSFIVFTEFRKHRKENTVFLIDEPASNLHAEAQEKVMKSINKLCDKSTVIYSTHSPYLLQAENLRNTILVKNEEESEFKPPRIKCNYVYEEMVDGNESVKYIRPVIDHLLFVMPSVLKKTRSEDGIIRNLKDTLKLNHMDSKKINRIYSFIKDAIYWIKILPS